MGGLTNGNKPIQTASKYKWIIFQLKLFQLNIIKSLDTLQVNLGAIRVTKWNLRLDANELKTKA